MNITDFATLSLVIGEYRICLSPSQAEENVRTVNKKGRFPYQPVVSPSLLNIGTGATLTYRRKYE
jgi:hypothetical protein